MSRKRMQRPARQTRRRRDAEAQCLLEFCQPACRGESAWDERNAANPATRLATNPATCHTPSPKGAKGNSPGQRRGNSAKQNPSRVEAAEESELPEGWQMRPLGDCLALIRNGLTATQNRGGIGHPVTRIETISEDRINPQKVGYVAEATEEQVGRYAMQTGDILFSHINSEPQLGRTAIYESVNQRLLHGMNLLLLRANECMDPWFLHYQCQQLRSRGVFIGLAARAVGQSSINQGKLKTLGIAKPPLPEQRAIAAVLRTVQRAKEACEQVLAATRQLKASLLHHLFTYGPVPFAQADRVELQETEIGPAPSSWPTKRFDDFVTLQRGQDLRREDFEDGTVPVIGATSIIGFHREANVKGPGVTVVRSGSSAGKPLFINRDFWAHNVVLYVKDFHGNDVKFVYHKLGMLDLTRFRAGVAVPTLNRNTFSGIMVDVPPLSEQREIARQLAAVDAKLVALEMRRAALASLFASLLHHLMTGQVRLPAAMRAGAAQGGLPEFPNAKAPRRAVTPEAPA